MNRETFIAKLTEIQGERRAITLPTTGQRARRLRGSPLPVAPGIPVGLPTLRKIRQARELSVAPVRVTSDFLVRELLFLIMNKKLVLLPALASLLALTLPTASAVPVTFSGGNGSPLSMTLLQPVTYTITAGFVGELRFVFQNTGNLASDAADGVTQATGDINFAINAGPPSDFLDALGSLIPGEPVIPSDPMTPNDLFVFDASSLDAVLIGDTVVLSAGTLTTASVDGPIPIPQAPPVGTDFSTFIVGHLDPVSVRISGPGTVGSVSVPDSLSTLWLGLPIAVMLAFAQLRRLAARFQSA